MAAWERSTEQDQHPNTCTSKYELSSYLLESPWRRLPRREPLAPYLQRLPKTRRSSPTGPLPRGRQQPWSCSRRLDTTCCLQPLPLRTTQQREGGQWTLESLQSVAKWRVVANRAAGACVPCTASLVELPFCSKLSPRRFTSVALLSRLKLTSTPAHWAAARTLTTCASLEDLPHRLNAITATGVS